MCLSKYDSFLGFWCNMFVYQKVVQGFSVLAESMPEFKFQRFSTVLPHHLYRWDIFKDSLNYCILIPIMFGSTTVCLTFTSLLV